MSKLEETPNAGVFYLHKDGTFVWKSSHQIAEIVKYVSSHTIKRFWTIPKESPTGTAEGDAKWVLSLLYSAFSSGAHKDDLCTFIKNLGIQDAEAVYFEFVLLFEKEQRAS
jgi:hypothetical protein